MFPMDEFGEHIVEKRHCGIAEEFSSKIQNAQRIRQVVQKLYQPLKSQSQSDTGK